LVTRANLALATVDYWSYTKLAQTWMNSAGEAALDNLVSWVSSQHQI